MKYAVKQVVPDRGERLVNMPVLPAFVAEFADQRRAAIETGAVSVGAMDMLAGARLDAASHESPGGYVAGRFESPSHVAKLSLWRIKSSAFELGWRRMLKGIPWLIFKQPFRSLSSQPWATAAARQ